GGALQPRRQVQSDASRGLLLRGPVAGSLTDDDQTSRNAHPHSQRLTGRQKQLAGPCDEIEPGAHSPFGIVFMSLRICEISENAVANESRDITADVLDRGRAGSLEETDDLRQILGIEFGRERRRAHKIAKHHSEMASFRLSLART